MNTEWECGDGWADIINPLVKVCELEGVEIQQIKEKFGVLRFYVTPGAPSWLYELIYTAERASSVTCEMCGQIGKLVSSRGGWLKTLCDHHAQEYTSVKNVTDSVESAGVVAGVEGEKPPGSGG